MKVKHMVEILESTHCYSDWNDEKRDSEGPEYLRFREAQLVEVVYHAIPSNLKGPYEQLLSLVYGLNFED